MNESCHLVVFRPEIFFDAKKRLFVRNYETTAQNLNVLNLCDMTPSYLLIIMEIFSRQKATVR